MLARAHLEQTTRLATSRSSRLGTASVLRCAHLALRCGQTCLLVWLLIPSVTAHAQESAEQLAIAVGEQTMLSAQGVTNYSIGAGGIVDVRLTPDAKSFIIVGSRAGTTSLLLLYSDGNRRSYQVTVSPPGGPTPDQSYGPGTVSSRANIRLDVYFVQLSEEYGHQVGVSWPSQLGNAALSATLDIGTGSLVNSSALVTGQALPQLDLAQTSGWAKVLRKAAVITANGAEAKFSGGGEVNIAIEGGLGGSLAQISYGSIVRVRPRYDSESGRIELAVTADVSDLTSDGGTGVPGRTTSTINTLVNLEIGETLVLAGLTAASQSRSHSGLPGLSQIPILGGLFGGHRERHEQTKVVVFIVPTVLDAVPAQSREAVRQALSQYKAYTGELDRVKLLEVSP